jgi:hypothetical protein
VYIWGAAGVLHKLSLQAMLKQNSMLRKCLLYLFFSLTISNLSTRAQKPSPIYSAEKMENGKSQYNIYDYQGKKLFSKAVDWAYSNTWSWIFVLNKNSKLIKAYDSKGNYFGIDSIQETQSTYSNLNRTGIKKYNKWGFYDRTGKMKIAHDYDEISHFKNDKAAVKVGNSIYMIDTNGVRLLEAYKDDKNYGFEDSDIALGMGGDFYNFQHKKVEQNKKIGLSDKQGTLVIPAIYDYLFDIKEEFELISARIGDMNGVLHFDNKVIIPIEYKSVFILNDYF